MRKEIITQVQETQRVPNRINPRRNTPRHILIKLTKIKHKEQILKAARGSFLIRSLGAGTERPLRVRLWNTPLAFVTIPAFTPPCSSVALTKATHACMSMPTFAVAELEKCRVGCPPHVRYSNPHGLGPLGFSKWHQL